MSHRLSRGIRWPIPGPMSNPIGVGSGVGYPHARFNWSFDAFATLLLLAHFPTPPPQPKVSRVGSGNRDELAASIPVETCVRVARRLRGFWWVRGWGGK